MPIVNRVRDVLGALGNSPTYPTEGMINQPEGDNISRRMSELYRPEHQDSDAFNTLLSSYPERGHPGTLRKIGASLTALGPGGYEAGHHALQQPFYDQLEDWKNKIVPTSQAMGNERAENSNMRALANSIISNERMHERDLTSARQGDERLGQGNIRLAQGDERLNQADARLKQGDERIKIARAVAKGGQLAIDKSTGQGKMVYKDGTSIPVDVSKLSEEELIDLQQQNALERIGAQGEQTRQNRAISSARDRLRTEVIDDPENPGTKILVRINLDTNEVTPVNFKNQKPDKTSVTPVTKTPETEANKARGILEKAKQVKASNPQFNKWITIRGNDFTLTRPGIFSGPTKEQYDQMYNAIYKSNRATDNVNPEERVNVINPKGQPVSIKKSQLEEALKSGYKRAQ